MGGLLFWGAKQGQTNKQTNGQRARVYEKNVQGVKSSSSSSLALVLDSSGPKLVLIINPGRRQRTMRGSRERRLRIRRIRRTVRRRIKLTT